MIYTSRARADLDPGDLDAIVDHASRRNVRTGITGMLWWDGANFAQVLEGPHDAIERTMQRIRNDGRHGDMAVVLDRPVAGRVFGDWAMKRCDTDPESTANTSFLTGLAASERTPAARRLFEVMLTCEG
jgi:hypothetical protein